MILAPSTGETGCDDALDGNMVSVKLFRATDYNVVYMCTLLDCIAGQDVTFDDVDNFISSSISIFGYDETQI